jgi:hypothetical protein
MTNPVVRISGMVADRSKGVGKYSASMVMKDHPKWVEYIKSITGCSKV